METPKHLLELRAEMDQCQERVVNLLSALRFIMEQRPGTAHANKEGLRERLRNVFASARTAIIQEEKEETS